MLTRYSGLLSELATAQHVFSGQELSTEYVDTFHLFKHLQVPSFTSVSVIYRARFDHFFKRHSGLHSRSSLTMEPAPGEDSGLQLARVMLHAFLDRPCWVIWSTSPSRIPDFAVWRQLCYNLWSRPATQSRWTTRIHRPLAVTAGAFRAGWTWSVQCDSWVCVREKVASHTCQWYIYRVPKMANFPEMLPTDGKVRWAPVGAWPTGTNSFTSWLVITCARVATQHAHRNSFHVRSIFYACSSISWWFFCALCVNASTRLQSKQELSSFNWKTAE